MSHGGPPPVRNVRVTHVVKGGGPSAGGSILAAAIKFCFDIALLAIQVAVIVTVASIKFVAWASVHVVWPLLLAGGRAAMRLAARAAQRADEWNRRRSGGYR